MGIRVVLISLLLLPLLSHYHAIAVSTSGNDGLPDDFIVSTKVVQRNSEEILTTFTFFWHDTSGGSDPSAVLVAQSDTAAQSATHFGGILVMDDALTYSLDRSSLLLGKSQGIYSSTDKQTTSLLMVMTFSFLFGDYNGSTIVVSGRNEIHMPTREMAITGGTGMFRLARGYVVIETKFFDPLTRYNIVKYNCYIYTSPLNNPAVDYYSATM